VYHEAGCRQNRYALTVCCACALTGRIAGQNRAEVWAPAGGAGHKKDGSLLIADDTGGTIWRVSYSGPKQQTGQPPNTTGARPN
jgi:hypothetical protein